MVCKHLFFGPKHLSLGFVAACVALASATFLTGCSSTAVSMASASRVSVTGNWQVASTAPQAARLPIISGELTGSGDSITGIFHAGAGSTCVTPANSFELTGAADSDNQVTLRGTGVAGGTLTLAGTLAADGKSISNATYNVSGGSCAFAKAATATAQAFTPINGTYNGSFSDPDGNLLSVSANLTQSPASDTDGNFQLSGTGTFGQNPCFNSPVTVSNTQVTGGSFSLTYSDPTTLNSVTANGTFSPDGTMLTVTGWTLTGSCGPDAGTGLLTRQ